MAEPIGKRRWAIAEGYIPDDRDAESPDPALHSHESFCVLNASDRDAHIAVTIFFKDREPAGPYRLTAPARRTLHTQFNKLADPEPIPRGTEYSSLIESDVPIVVQHTRLDSRPVDIALMTTLAFGSD